MFHRINEKNNTGMFLWTKVHCFSIVQLPAAKSKNIQLLYLNTDSSHVKNFFQNILLKTAWLCDVRLQNYGAINFVQFFWTTL